MRTEAQLRAGRTDHKKTQLRKQCTAMLRQSDSILATQTQLLNSIGDASRRKIVSDYVMETRGFVFELRTLLRELKDIL